VAASGRRYVYLPTDRMRGTRIEIIEEVEAAPGAPAGRPGR
jgi:hypothetical protein